MGANVPADRFLRPTNITGNVYELNTAAGAAANNATVARYAAGGVAANHTRRYRPTQVTTTNVGVPAAGTAPANDGWRDLNAIDATNQITFDAGDWTVRLRYRRSGQALEQNVVGQTTVILYNGTTGAELGRRLLNLTYTTAVQTASFLINPGSEVFAAGDKMQIEVYVVTLTAGLPAAPAVATDLWLTINESDANSGAKVTPQTYAVNYVRSLSATMVGAMGTDLNTNGRRATLFRTLAVTMVGAASAAKRVGKTLAATMVGVTPVLVRRVGKTLAATMVGVAPAPVKKVGKTLTATMVGTATLARALTLFRSMSATAVGIATLARVLTARRTLAATATGTATLARALTLHRTMAAAMVGTASAAKKVGKTLSATMVGAATLARTLTLARTMAATMLGVAAMTRALTLRRSLAAVMVGAASLTRALTLHRTLAATMVGAASVQKLVGKVMPAVAMVGVASLARTLTLFRTLAATMVGTASLTRALVLARTLAATMVGVARGVAGIPFERVPSGGGIVVEGNTYSRSRVDNR